MYGKIFDSMYEGTLYGHWEAIVTMQQMIVLSDADGIVDMTPQAIAARTSIPLEIIKEGIRVLSDPDPDSRTPGSEGRRIELIDSHRSWGWHLINHDKYKKMVDAVTVREQTRERVRRHRAERAAANVTLGNAGNAEKRHTDTYTETDTKTESAHAGTLRGQFAKVLREAGVKITPGNPLIQDWLTAGVTEAQLLEAVARARLNKPDGQIAANYLAPIVTDILHPKAPVVRDIQIPSQTMKGAMALRQMRENLK